jgi:hypothetical protein
MSAPPPKLRAKTSKPATAFFVLYMAALIAYFVIRCRDIAVAANWLFTAGPRLGSIDWGERG